MREGERLAFLKRLYFRKFRILKAPGLGSAGGSTAPSGVSRAGFSSFLIDQPAENIRG